MPMDLDWKRLGNESSQMLAELLQINTTNPPGDEYKAIQYLQKHLDREGLSYEILEKQKGRSNLIARMKGTRPGPRLMLMSHVDVVPVTDEKKWKYPPFSGAIAEGYIWGRGALDMKCMTAMEFVTFMLFKRLKLDFAGELILLAAADEEQGSTYGAEWLCKTHPDKMKSDYVLNEGGGVPLVVGNKIFYTIENAEKGLWWFRVKVKGTSGHGSIPHADNALAKSAYIIDKVAKYRFPKKVSPSVKELITKLADAMGPDMKKIAIMILDESKDTELPPLPMASPVSAPLVNSMTHTGISPTMIRAGVKENVIPDGCEFVLDCRLVPGDTREKVKATLMELAGEFHKDLEIETIQTHDVSESPITHEFYKLIAQTTKSELPGVETVPFMMTGATDSRFVRELGTAAYGFCPFSNQMPAKEREKLIHNDNERIDLESMELGTKLIAKIAMKALQAKG
jgi:acetylornithine deacetylase/succinyl-diaminopimelate desuccinylase-like protein